MELQFKKREILVGGCYVLGKMTILNKDTGEVVSEFRQKMEYNERGFVLNTPNKESAIQLMNTSINQFKKSTIEKFKA